MEATQFLLSSYHLVNITKILACFGAHRADRQEGMVALYTGVFLLSITQSTAPTTGPMLLF